MSWGSLFHPKDTYGWRALPNKPLAHRYVVRETVRGTLLAASTSITHQNPA
jgi:hypothetical protein